MQESHTDLNISVNASVRKLENELVLNHSIYLMIGELIKDNETLIICVVPSVPLSNLNVQLLKIPRKCTVDSTDTKELQKVQNSYYDKIRKKRVVGGVKSPESEFGISLWKNSVFCVVGLNHVKSDEMQTKVWNDAWGGLEGHSTVVIPKNNSLRSIILNSEVLQSFQVANNRLGMTNTSKPRQLAGKKRERDIVIKNTNKPEGVPNLYNLREEALSKVDGAFSINLTPNQIAQAWSRIKEYVDTFQSCESDKREVLTAIASRFLMDQTWKVEDQNGSFVKIEEMEVDIDQAAATFKLHIDHTAKIDDNDEVEAFKFLEKYANLICRDVFLNERGIYEEKKIVLNHPTFMKNDRAIFGKGVTHMKTGRETFTGLTTNNSFPSPFKLSVRENPDIDTLKRRLWKLSLVVAKFLKTFGTFGSLYQHSEFELGSLDSEYGTLLMSVHWGPLHSFLTLLLFAFTNDQDVFCAMEAFNNKHFGIRSGVNTSWLYSESPNDSFVMPRDHDTQFNIIAGNMHDRNKHGAPFVIWRFFEMLKHEEITIDAKFRWGWGCTLYKIDCLIGLTDLFVPDDLKNLRQKSTADVFKECTDVDEMILIDNDNADDEEDNMSDGEYNKHVNERKKKKLASTHGRHRNDPVLYHRHRAQFFPPGGMLPLIATPCTFYRNEHIKYSKAIREMSSPFVFGQYYSVDNRYDSII